MIILNFRPTSTHSIFNRYYKKYTILITSVYIILYLPEKISRYIDSNCQFFLLRVIIKACFLYMCTWNHWGLRKINALIYSTVSTLFVGDMFHLLYLCRWPCFLCLNKHTCYQNSLFNNFMKGNKHLVVSYMLFLHLSHHVGFITWNIESMWLAGLCWVTVTRFFLWIPFPSCTGPKSFLVLIKLFLTSKRELVISTNLMFTLAFSFVSSRFIRIRRLWWQLDGLGEIAHL